MAGHLSYASYAIFDTPLGHALAVIEGGDGEHLVELSQLDSEDDAELAVAARYPGAALDPDAPLLRRTREQLDEYFAGSRTDFDLPLEPHGTDFQRRVWQGLLDIPYGETRSYRQLAEMVDCPGGYQAVGQANRNNPIGIVIPCHRVIAADGKLGGYGGGTVQGARRKRWLLELEAPTKHLFTKAIFP
jgi:methylated-DNA-[protein]-cysteine S-methyltransferase